MASPNPQSVTLSSLREQFTTAFTPARSDDEHGSRNEFAIPGNTEVPAVWPIHFRPSTFVD
jgi:hypothetical protein